VYNVRGQIMQPGGVFGSYYENDDLSDHGTDTLGLATVYRNLASLVEDDRADILTSPDGENLYRACSTSGHHHHLICRQCGKTVEIEADAVEQWAQAVASTHGFTDAHHVVDVFGICASCA
jgi:Fur family ferric uptake transcriptional regulator